MTIIITGAANTGGASLNRSARCSGCTRRLKEPLAPRGIWRMACPQKALATNMMVQTSGTLLTLSTHSSARYSRRSGHRRRPGEEGRKESSVWWVPLGRRLADILKGCSGIIDRDQVIGVIEEIGSAKLDTFFEHRLLNPKSYPMWSRASGSGC